MRTPYEYMEFTNLPKEAMSQTQICELIVGTGKTIIAGSTVKAHVTAFVEDSKHLFYTTEGGKAGPYKWKAGRGEQMFHLFIFYCLFSVYSIYYFFPFLVLCYIFTYHLIKILMYSY